MEVQKIRRQELYHGRVIDLWVDEVEYPSGNRSIREIAHHSGGAVTVPLLEDGRVLLVRQLRYPLGTHILELPAGKLSPGEDPRAAAARELEEETGYRATLMRPLASFYTTPGFCDEVLHLFLATGLAPVPGGHRREEGEFTMTIETPMFQEALAMIDEGKIRDGKSIAGLLLAERVLRREAR